MHAQDRFTTAAARSALNIEKLKNKARKLEEKGQVDKAIEVYLELFSGLEGRPEIANELSLFNRAGDLYLRASKVPEAVEMYERAATLYADHGFPNNAIALCNKVLRNAPGRTHIYLTLAQLMVERGFVAEAKQNLLEYADRMQKAGKTDEAFRALKEFADLSPENEEIRLLLAEQLKAAARTAEAREQLAKLFHEAEASGDQRRSRATLAQIRAIDPEFDPSEAPKVKVKERKEKSSDLIFLDVDAEYRTDTAVEEAEKAPDEPEALTIEPTALDAAETAADEADVGLERLDGLEVAPDFEEQAADVPSIGFEPTSLVEPAAEPVEDLGAADAEPAETIERFSADDLDFQVTPELPDALELPEVEEIPAAEPVGAIEVPDLDLEGFDAATDVDVTEAVVQGEAVEQLEEIEDFPDEDVAAAEAGPALPLLATADDLAPAEVDLATLEAAVADDPDHPGHHVALGEALLERGERARGLEELDIALTLHEGREEWSRAGTLIDEILRLDNNSVRHHQKRVEQAYRTGDKRHLVEAYVGLGDALVRSEAMERAKLVYKRVLEHEPDNKSALAALESLEPESPAVPEPAGADFVDLGALIFEDEPQRDTRMRVQDEEPTGDEERDFQELLAQFKRGIEANIEEDDWQAHYDLGVAFKEMGLLDEAIAQFQKALRSPAGRLRTAEALGGCFFDKHQFSVAATVMRRAVETDAAGDEAKIGLLYWLGRCDEEMGRTDQALGHFQRVFALDIRFADVAERVKRLAGSVS